MSKADVGKSVRPYLKNTLKAKGLDMDQMVECLWHAQGLQFNPKYHKKKECWSWDFLKLKSY
jgi:hypothetical protein